MALGRETAASRFHLFTFAFVLLGMSALPPKADIRGFGWHVCFVPIADNDIETASLNSHLLA